MNRKNFITTIGVVTGGALAGMRRNSSSDGITSFPHFAGSEDDLWNVVRQEFSFPDGYIFLNTGAMGKDNIRVRPVSEAELNGVRVSFHLYNNMDEEEKAMISIKKFLNN